MIRNRSIVLGILFSSALLIGGCHHDQPEAAAPMPMQDDSKVTAVAVIRPSQAATTQPSENNVMGTITFTQAGDGVAFVAEIDGFAPNTKHGFHIHEKGDLSAPDLSSAKGHFDPTHEAHGAPDAAHHHMGDMGNLEADANGHAKLEGVFKGASLNSGADSIVGRSVIIHGKTDDLKSQPSGNSGPRIAGGVITLSK
jgi:Cu-Zn family superoxide dismutase